MNNFKCKLKKTLRLCKEELIKRKNGIEGESTEEQLEKSIIPELSILLKLMDENKLPLKEKRYLNSFASAFTVWGWNMQNPTEIFVLLGELNNDYKEL